MNDKEMERKAEAKKLIDTADERQISILLAFLAGLLNPNSISE